jgi:hypothetical protein
MGDREVKIRREIRAGYLGNFSGLVGQNRGHKNFLRDHSGQLYFEKQS